MQHKRKGLHLLVLLALMLTLGIYFPHHEVLAASAVQVASVEYYDEDVVVFNNTNTKFYYALDTDAARGKWDIIPADSGKFTKIDTSWISDYSDNVLVIKGDIDAASRVILKPKPKKLSISINYTNLDSLSSTAVVAPLLNIMTTEGDAANPIAYEDLEWRKGVNGTWRNSSSLTKSVLEKFLVKGTDLYFRIRAVDDCVSINVGGMNKDINDDRKAGIIGGICAYESVSGATFGMDYTHGTGYPDGMDGRRFSDPVKVKIIKKTASMVYDIDGSKFFAKLKYGKEYKVTLNYANGTHSASNWVQVTDKSISSIPLSTFALNASPSSTFNGTTSAFPAMDIQIRDFATAKSASSAISTLSLDAQRKLNSAIQIGQPSVSGIYTADDIFVYYFGDKYINLAIPKASSDLPYEYCIVKNGETFDLNHQTWYTITKNTGIKLLANRAPQDSTIYVRQKEIKSKAATNASPAVSYKLASTYVSLKLNYPSTPVVTPQSIDFIKNYTAAPTIQVQLNTAGKAAFENKVQSVKLGTKEIRFTTVPAGGASLNPAIVNNMTITLNKDDLNALANCTNRLLTITFANGIVDKTSVKLTIRSSNVSGSLTLTIAAGSAGKTKVSTVNTIGAGDTWVYATSTTEVTNLHVNDTLSVTHYNFTSGAEISGLVVGQYLTVYEIDAGSHIIKFKCIKITAAMIGA